MFHDYVFLLLFWVLQPPTPHPSPKYLFFGARRKVSVSSILFVVRFHSFPHTPRTLDGEQGSECRRAFVGKVFPDVGNL